MGWSRSALSRVIAACSSRWKFSNSSDGLGRDLRGVAGKNDNVVVGGERRLRDHESMASAALLGLQDEIDARMGERGTDAVGFVADDGEDVR